MRKYLVFVLLLITSLACFALEKPRWVGLPIYVYIPENGQMSKLMKQAFESWEKSSKSLVRFKFVNNPNTANIEVEFVDFVANCNDAGAVGCTEMMTSVGQYHKAYVKI